MFTTVEEKQSLFTAVDLEKERQKDSFLLAAEEVLEPYRSGCRIRWLKPSNRKNDDDFIVHLKNCSVAFCTIGMYRSAMIVVGPYGPKMFLAGDTYINCVNKYLLEGNPI